MTSLAPSKRQQRPCESVTSAKPSTPCRRHVRWMDVWALSGRRSTLATIPSGSPRRAGGRSDSSGSTLRRPTSWTSRSAMSGYSRGPLRRRYARESLPRRRSPRPSATSLVPSKPSRPTSKNQSIPWRLADSPSKPREGRPPYSWSATTSGPACWLARSGQPPWISCGRRAWTRPSRSKRSAKPPTVQPRSPRTRPSESGRCPWCDAGSRLRGGLKRAWGVLASPSSVTPARRALCRGEAHVRLQLHGLHQPGPLFLSTGYRRFARPFGARYRCREEEGDRLRGLPGARLPRRRRRSLLLESLRPRDALGVGRGRTRGVARAAACRWRRGRGDRDGSLQVRFSTTTSRRDRGEIREALDPRKHCRLFHPRQLRDARRRGAGRPLRRQRACHGAPERRLRKEVSRGSGGRIVNFSSGQSLGPMPGELAYVATKGAIEAFTRTLAAEVGNKGITVNAVNPGPTDTGWMTEELKREIAPRFPSGRIGQPEDAAKLVAFLAGDEAAWITGQVIHSEGGFLRY